MIKFCMRCEHIGESRTDTPGSFFIELLLWLCFIIPGLIYSIWRLTARHDACASCGSRDIIPLSSPAAQRRLTEHPEMNVRLQSAREEASRISPRIMAGLIFIGAVGAFILLGALMDKLSAALYH